MGLTLSNFPASFFITNYQAFNIVKAAGHFWTFFKVQANGAVFKPEPLCDSGKLRHQPNHISGGLGVKKEGT